MYDEPRVHLFQSFWIYYSILVQQGGLITVDAQIREACKVMYGYFSWLENREITCEEGRLILKSLLFPSIFDLSDFGINHILLLFLASFIYTISGLPEQPKSISCRILVAMWWLASLTLMATFTGSLVAFFAVDKAARPFTSTCLLAHKTSIFQTNDL